MLRIVGYDQLKVEDHVDIGRWGGVEQIAQEPEEETDRGEAKEDRG